MGSPSTADILPADLRKPVLGAKLLLVGAGGIGCEVLKNLVLAGFNNIEVVSISCNHCHPLVTNWWV